MQSIFNGIRVVCGLNAIREPLEIVQTSTYKWQEKDYPLYSLANNKPFYEYMNSCHADDVYEYTSSLDKIIEKHKELPMVYEDIKIGENIGKGGFNTVYKTDDPNKVFRKLHNFYSSSDYKYSQKGTSKPKVLINGKERRINLNSIRELYGLIIQYYFTQNCVDHVCKVYDFGIMKFKHLSISYYIAYAVLQSAQLDMKNLFDGMTQLSKTVRNNLTLDSFKKMWIDLLSAIKCIHNNGFVHLDIKPQNVGLIVKDDGTITPILIDFGFTSPIGSNVCIKMSFGTRAYKLPKFNNYTCSIQSDMYAYLIMITNELFDIKEKKIQPLYLKLVNTINTEEKKIELDTISQNIYDLELSIIKHEEYQDRENLYSTIDPWFDLHHEITTETTGGNRMVYKYQKSRKNRNKNKILKKHNQSRKKFLK